MEEYFEVFQENVLVGKVFSNNTYHKSFKLKNAEKSALQKGKELIANATKNKAILKEKFTKITVIVRKTNYDGNKQIVFKESLDLIND